MGEEGKTLQTDVDDILGDMLGGTGSGAEVQEEEKEEESSESESEEKAEVEEEEEEESEEEKEDEEESADEEEEEPEDKDKDESEEEEEEEEEGEDKDALIAKLRKQLSDGGGEPEPEPEVEPEQKPDEFSVLGDADLDTLLDDPKEFNKVLGGSFERFGNLLMKKFLTSIPQVVMHQVKQQSVIRTAVDEFYKENEDLGGYRKLVGATVNEVVSDNPDWKMDKVFNEAAVRSRKVLGLKKIAKKTKEGRKNPSFVKPKGKSGKSGVKSKPSKLQKDISALIADDD